MTPWPSTALKRASVSSFGFGGTNVHIIMEESRESRDYQTPASATPIGKSHAMNGAVPNGIGDKFSKSGGTLSNGIGYKRMGLIREQSGGYSQRAQTQDLAIEGSFCLQRLIKTV